MIEMNRMLAKAITEYLLIISDNNIVVDIDYPVNEPTSSIDSSLRCFSLNFKKEKELIVNRESIIFPSGAESATFLCYFKGSNIRYILHKKDILALSNCNMLLHKALIILDQKTIEIDKYNTDSLKTFLSIITNFNTEVSNIADTTVFSKLSVPLITLVSETYDI